MSQEQFGFYSGNDGDAKIPKDSLPYEAQCTLNKEKDDKRSLIRRIAATLYPFAFGNDEEYRAAIQRLHNSLAKETRALAGGTVEIMTLPTAIPTTAGFGITDEILDFEALSRLRDAAKQQLK